MRVSVATDPAAPARGTVRARFHIDEDHIVAIRAATAGGGKHLPEMSIDIVDEAGSTVAYQVSSDGGASWNATSAAQSNLAEEKRQALSSITEKTAKKTAEDELRDLDKDVKAKVKELEKINVEYDQR